MTSLSTVDASPTLLSWIMLGGMGLAAVLLLYCIFTIYRNRYFNEVQKFGWLIICLAFPIFGPISWLVRARLEKKYHQVSSRLTAREGEHIRQVAKKYPAYRPGQSVLFRSGDQVNPESSGQNPYLVQKEDGTRGLSF